MATFTCPFCEMEMDADPQTAFRHMRIENVMVERLKMEHPEWQQKDGVCSRCIVEFRKSVPKEPEPNPPTQNERR